MLEKVARALAIADRRDPDAPAWVQYPGGHPFGLCWRDQYGDKAHAAIAAVFDALAEPSPTAVAFALPLTNEPSDDDWRIGDGACEVLDCVNTDGELAAAQLVRDYRNVLA